MPAWEWILLVASFAIVVTAVTVATVFVRDRRHVPAAVPVIALSVPSFATTMPATPGQEPVYSV
jgi:hypothetical protein